LTPLFSLGYTDPMKARTRNRRKPKLTREDRYDLAIARQRIGSREKGRPFSDFVADLQSENLI